MTLPKNLQPFFPYLLAAIAGVLLPLSLAPFNYTLAAFFSPAILLFCLSKASPKKGFLLGACFGWGLFGFGFSWIYFSIHDYTSTPTLLAMAFTALFAFLMGFFSAFMSYLLVRFFPENNVRRCVLAFPVLWVLFELLRGWAFTGLPWLYIGYSQLFTHLSALAPIGGVWLVSWATVFISALLYSIFDYVYEHKRKPALRNTLVFVLLASWIGATYIHKNINWTHPTGEAINVSLIQGNIPQSLRWDPNEVQNTLRTYQALTASDLQSNPKPDIIVWPESAIPVPLPQSQGFLTSLDTQLKKIQVALITGVPVETHNPKTGKRLTITHWLV
jgi:apolipoprotein N-acyltransferase